MRDNPVIKCLDCLRQLECRLGDDEDMDEVEVVGLFDSLTQVCSVEGSGNAAIATKNGGVELLCAACSKIPKACHHALVSALKAMASLLHGEIFGLKSSTPLLFILLPLFLNIRFTLANLERLRKTFQ